MNILQHLRKTKDDREELKQDMINFCDKEVLKAVYGTEDEREYRKVKKVILSYFSSLLPKQEKNENEDINNRHI